MPYKNIINRNKDVVIFIKDYCRKKNKSINSLKVSFFVAVPTYIVFRVIGEIENVFTVGTLIFVAITYLIAFLLIFSAKNDKLLSNKSNQEIFRLSKAVFVNTLLKSLDKRINYYPTKKLLNKSILVSKIIKTKVTEIKGSDLMSLEVGQKQIQLSILTIYSGLRIAFRGIFVHISNVNTENIEENIRKLKCKNRYSINDNNIFIAIPLKFNKFLTVELKRKEKSLKTFMEQITLVFDVFKLFESMAQVKFEAITEDKRLCLYEKYKLKINIAYENIAFGMPRIINLIVDNIVISVFSSILIILFYLVFYFVSIPIQIEIVALIIYPLTFLVYYILFETIYGKTLGKFLTKTKVVDSNNNKPSFKNILSRSLLRLIPFDFYSYVFNDLGWHDKYSKTKVVYEKNLLPVGDK